MSRGEHRSTRQGHPSSALGASDLDTSDLDARRRLLDEVTSLVDAAERAQRLALLGLVRMWPTAAWRLSGAHSAQAWLGAYTALPRVEARRLVRLGELCAGHESMTRAIEAGELSLGRADLLARLVTRPRAPFLAGSLPALLALSAATADDDVFLRAVRFWAEQADQEAAVTHPTPHHLHLSERLFGGGRIDGELSPAAFANVAAALDAWIQDPDPSDAPYQRTLGERRADALDDLAHFGLTHACDDDDACGADDQEFEDLLADDTFDGGAGDALDQLLRGSSDDPLDALRDRLRVEESEQRRRARRRVRPRSGVTVDVHIDLDTLAGRRLGDDLGGLDLRAAGWSLAERSARLLLCDAALVATLFDGRRGVLDSNDAAERFSRRQRRALAARDGHCVFPSCTRHPRWCDAHHLEHRAHGGATALENGALLCRFHHRLVHEQAWSLERCPETGRWSATDRHGETWTGTPAEQPLVTSAAGPSPP